LFNWIAAFSTIVFNVLSWSIAILSGCQFSDQWHSTGHFLGSGSFILFIGDIGVICSGSVIHKFFAGDVKFYSTIDTNLDIVSLQSALDRLHLTWCCNWQLGLSVNVGKCHVLPIGKTNHH